MLGHDDDYVAALERAHSLPRRGEALARGRCAFWIGHNLLLRGETGARDGLVRTRAAAARGREDGLRRAGLPAAAAVAASRAAWGLRRRDRRPPRGGGDRRALRRRRPVRAGPRRPGPRADQARPGRRRLCGCSTRRMVAVTAGDLSPIVTGFVYCSMIACCQEASCCAARGVDRGADALVRAAARHGRLHRPCLVHRAEIMQLQARGRRRSRRRSGPPSGCARATNQTAAGAGPLPAGRDPPPARRARRGRGGVSRSEPVRLRAAARPRAVAAGAGGRRRRGSRDPPGDRRDDRSARSRGAAARLRRDHAGDRRPRGGAPRLPRARGDRRAVEGTMLARAGRAGAGSGLARRGRCERRARRAAAGASGSGASSRRRTRRRGRGC